MKPRRIQRKRLKGWRMPANTISVTRPGPFGNPFIGPLAVAAFREWLAYGRSDTVLRGDAGVGMAFMPTEECRCRIVSLLPSLRGRNLACFCPLGKPCHADVLIELANA